MEAFIAWKSRAVRIIQYAYLQEQLEAQMLFYSERSRVYIFVTD
jgi:hypothetical protein